MVSIFMNFKSYGVLIRREVTYNISFFKIEKGLITAISSIRYGVGGRFIVITICLFLF